jgi:hypothetical protein
MPQLHTAPPFRTSMRVACTIHRHRAQAARDVDRVTRTRATISTASLDSLPFANRLPASSTVMTARNPKASKLDTRCCACLLALPAAGMLRSPDAPSQG